MFTKLLVNHQFYCSLSHHWLHDSGTSESESERAVASVTAQKPHYAFYVWLDISVPKRNSTTLGMTQQFKNIFSPLLS